MLKLSGVDTQGAYAPPVRKIRRPNIFVGDFSVIIRKNYHQPLCACLTKLSDATLQYIALLRQRVCQSVKLQIFNSRSKTDRKPCVPPPLIAKYAYLTIPLKFWVNFHCTSSICSGFVEHFLYSKMYDWESWFLESKANAFANRFFLITTYDTYNTDFALQCIDVCRCVKGDKQSDRKHCAVRRV